jgi:hypothetical protein
MRWDVGPDFPKYDTSVPYTFLSKHVGVSEADLRASMLKLRAKAVAEIASADQVNVSGDMVKKWKPIMDACIGDTLMFIDNPKSMQNWDLDCGRISTKDFDYFHEWVLKTHNGKLPKSWGKNYLKWWKEVQSLPSAERLGKIASLGTVTGTGFAGKWSTNIGELTLTGNGKTLSGTLEGSTGKGKFSGKIIRSNMVYVEGTFKCTWDKKALEVCGPRSDNGTFTISLIENGAQFTGMLYYGPGPSKG